MNHYTVYEHKNLINGKRYIGVTKQKPITRWANGKGYAKNKHFTDAIQKYGWDNFEHNILYENLSENEAYVLEKFLIKYYDLTNPDKGYNIAEGGLQRGPHSFEKMIEWQNDHKRFGDDNINSKKVKCIETGDIFGSISEAQRWANTSKIGEVCQGKREHAGRHPETNMLLSWEYAKEDEETTIFCHSREILNKIKKVKCIETNIIYDNSTEAEKATGVCRCNIARVCKGQRKTAGGMTWCYVEEE